MSQEIKDRFKQFVAPTYGRFPITLDRGEGAYVWDTDGKHYLDLGGGIDATSTKRLTNLS